MSGSIISELRDSGIMIQLMHRAMQELGVDVAAVFARCGITDELLNDKNIRTPHEAQLIFWTAVQEVSDDGDIGLHLAEKMPLFKGQVLQYLFLSSSTFGDGLSRALNYQRLLSDASQTSLVEEDGFAFIVIDTASDAVRQIRHLNECMAAALINFFKYVTSGGFTPSQLCFSHSAPENTSEHQRIYGCEVLFDQPDTRIRFSPEMLEIPSLHAEPELLHLHEKLASEHVAKLERQDVVVKVNRIIGEILETGQVNLEQVADRLGIKPRTLRTRLSEANTNFNQLLADYRCNLAKRLLAGTEESIDEIVYLTGFSEPSTFYRAFKRWTDLTPIEYRNQKRN